MKKFILGLIALSSISAYAENYQAHCKLYKIDQSGIQKLLDENVLGLAGPGGIFQGTSAIPLSAGYLGYRANIRREGDGPIRINLTGPNELDRAYSETIIEPISSPFSVSLSLPDGSAKVDCTRL